MAVPYSADDTAPPTDPYRRLDAQAHSLNCSSVQTYAEVDAYYKNVIVDVPPAPAP